MQLVAYGAQDIYLTGNPQITFFKVVYRRHTNFSMEAIQQTWNGSSSGSNARCTATISRNGDLVHRMYFEVNGTVQQNISNPGHSFITNVELEIGGQKIDKHTGVWMEAWAELTQLNPSGEAGIFDADGDAAVIGGTLFQRMSGAGGVAGDISAPQTDASLYFIPLQFWFCRNPGLALPLIALQYHEVKVILEHRMLDVFGSAAKNNLYCDYIYLDTDERRRFAQVSHEYLIEQVQEQTWSENSTELNFNHPVKELVLTNKESLAKSDGAMTSTSLNGTNILLKLNGHDRFSGRDFRYFTRTQVLEHHTGAGGLDCSTASHTGATTGAFNDTIGVYSFALKPEEHQPSGTCNFSRIDNAQLTGTGIGLTIDTVFAVNYNVLRIMSGMGGLAYSN